MSCDLTLLTPESVRRDGCLHFKGAVYVAQQASCAVLEWVFRDKAGAPWTPPECEDSLSEDEVLYVAKARFQIPDVPSIRYETDVTETDTPGTFRITVPHAVLDKPGIYQVQLGLLDPTSLRLLESNMGLLSVEASLWGSPEHRRGPITLEQLRVALRDSPSENELLREYEFDAKEVCEAMFRPIRYWNESPPNLRRFNSTNFPWPEHWLRATIGFLLETAAAWYLRNKNNVTAAGLNIRDRDKNAEYQRLAEMYREEWRTFVLRQKVVMNAAGSFRQIRHSGQAGNVGNW